MNNLMLSGNRDKWYNSFETDDRIKVTVCLVVFNEFKELKYLVFSF